MCSALVLSDVIMTATSASTPQWQPDGFHPSHSKWLCAGFHICQAALMHTYGCALRHTWAAALMHTYGL